MRKTSESELTVITRAKELCQYILTLSFRIFSFLFFFVLKGHAATGSNVNMHKNCNWKTSFPCAILCNIHTSQIVMCAFNTVKYILRKLKILTVTDKSPKKFRFTLVSRLQNYSLSVIEHLYKANHIFIGTDYVQAQFEKRLVYQQEAMTELRLLAYMSMIAREAQCILPKQQSQISAKIIETQKLLYAWIKSDERRRK